MRPLNLNPLDEDEFMLKEIGLSDFKEHLKILTFKKNSQPRKPNKFLERRMYGLVPYNISKIQQGIQFDHAKDNYYNNYFDDLETSVFRVEWKTSIILNGGTSNEGKIVRHGFKETLYKGTMQQHLEDLLANDIKVGGFYEPDLNSMLSAIVFLVDERVFDKDLYPDFVQNSIPNDVILTEKIVDDWDKNNTKQYNNWLEKIGGPHNEFLRTFLANKRLA